MFLNSEKISCSCKLEKKRIILIVFYFSVSLFSYGQIIADHTVVDLYDDIPEKWIDSVKKMVFTIAGESHRAGYYNGCEILETIESLYAFSVNSYPSGGNKTGNLTVAYGLWGDYDNETGWIGSHGEEDWFTNDIARSRIIASLNYCNNNGYPVDALGFGWCYDAEEGNRTTLVDPEYGVRWCGVTKAGPEGNRAWGLDAEDNSITGNSVSMNTYLSSTQSYIDHCTANDIPTKVFFTTGPVDSYASTEIAYQAYLKWEHVREYVKADPSRILFDYADILCYDDDGTPGRAIWNGHEFPHITETNLGLGDVGHIGSAGALRLGKALWWMMARIAGWDGSVNGEDTSPPSVPTSLSAASVSDSSIEISGMTQKSLLKLSGGLGGFDVTSPAFPVQSPPGSSLRSLPVGEASCSRACTRLWRDAPKGQGRSGATPQRLPMASP